MAKSKEAAIEVVCAFCDDKPVAIDRETDVKVYVNCHGAREGLPKHSPKDKRGRLVAFRSMKAERDAREAAAKAQPAGSSTSGKTRIYVDGLEKRAQVEIHPEKDGRPYVPLQVNLDLVRVKPGQKALIPWPHFEMLQNAKVTLQPTQQELSTNPHAKPRDVMRYPFSFHGAVLVNDKGEVVKRLDS